MTDTDPITKADLEGLEKRFDKQLESFRDVVLAHIDKTAEETKRHFDVVAENIHKDVAAANADEISSLKDADNKLHERVVPLEEKAGLESPEQPHRV